MTYHLDMKDSNTNPNLREYETEENEVVMYETDEEEFTPRPSILSGGSRRDTTLAVPAQHQTQKNCKAYKNSASKEE